MGFLWGFMDEGKVFCQLFFPILQKECKEYWPHNFGWSSWPTISIIISIIMPIFELSIRREWERHNGWFAKTTFARKSPCWAGMCIGLVYAIYTKYMYVYLYTARLYAYIYTYTYLFVQMYSLLPGQGTTYDATWGSVSSSSERTYRDIYIYIRSRKYSTTWDLPTCQAFQLLLVTRRWWSSLLEASEWWAILGGFLLLTIESNYLFELKSCSGAPDSTKTLQASLKFSNHWDAPICSPCQDASDKWVFS